ncbi:HD domain-containing phosphohydrolase [Aeromonas veronii]
MSELLTSCALPHPLTDALPSSALLLTQVMDQLPYRVLLKDTRFSYIAGNRLLAADLALSPEALVGKNDCDFFPPELVQRYREDDTRVMREGIHQHIEEPYLKGGEARWLSTTKFPLRDEAGSIVGVGVFFEDITEQKWQQEKLQQYSWTQQAISRAHHALLKPGDEPQLLQDICDAIAVDDRFPLVAVLQGQPELAQPPRIVAQAGSADASEQTLWFNDEALTQAILHQRRLNQVIFHERPHTGRHPLRSRLLIPLPLQEDQAGALIIHSDQPRLFSQEEEQLFIQLTDYLTYGLQARHTQQAYLRSQQEKIFHARQLELALEDALGAIAAVLEQRDPYTAGHQKHVAKLAQAIGRELRLEEKRLRGIYLGAMVHDIGKIQVPAEILTKPERLTPLEFELVKEHPAIGYLVLKDIDFPWPIARMIHQHHEYLDGSGYPQGLKGDEILLEARILTVADIVESMSSDRPYRAALGIPQAREQIIQMRGHQLDADVVDACLRILDRGDFIPQPLGKP